jgi:predicted acyltransferase
MTAPGPAGRTARVDSIDVFRGLTMFLMLFANDLNDPDLGHVANVPDWLRHMPAGRDAMTFVDVIFPAFLFSAGLSIPLALGRRLAAGGMKPALAHVAMRGLALVVIGLGMVNTYRFHPTAMPISPAWWEFLFFLAVILVWQATPAEEAGRTWARRRRVVGIVLLVALAVVYRGSDGGAATWMRTSWWGILTAIGFAYLIVAGGFLLTRGHAALMTGLVALLTAVNIGDRTGALAWLDPLRGYFSAGGMLGGLPSIMAAGALAGMMLFGSEPGGKPSREVTRLLGLAVGFALAGFLLRPPFGLSKLAETPAWCLLSTAICCALFALVYWIVDVKRIAAWAGFVRATGRQPLLAYFLPHLFYSLLGIVGFTWLDQHLNSGMPGIARSFVLALALVGLTSLLVRRRVNLKL